MNTSFLVCHNGDRIWLDLLSFDTNPFAISCPPRGMGLMDRVAKIYKKESWKDVEPWNKLLFFVGLLFLPFLFLDFL